MRRRIILFIWTMALMTLSSCEMMHEDRTDCPYGLYVKFKYDYNLQRADMFNDHVQALALYIYDEQGRLVRRQTAENTLEEQPLECPCYRMHVEDLPAGKYQLLAVAKTPGAVDNVLDAEQMQSLHILHDQTPQDTIWHGRDLETMRTGQMQLVELSDTRPTYDTISLVRDTKQILISISDLTRQEENSIEDYQIRILDRNNHIRWDNSLDETRQKVYEPIARWNIKGQGATLAQAQLMTSRVIDHQDDALDGRLQITDLRTGETVVDENLPFLLSYLRSWMDHRYTTQEFLDRCYDYTIEFYRTGAGQVETYVSLKIGVLSWTKRVQREVLQ